MQVSSSLSTIGPHLAWIDEVHESPIHPREYPNILVCGEVKVTYRIDEVIEIEDEEVPEQSVEV